MPCQAFPYYSTAVAVPVSNLPPCSQNLTTQGATSRPTAGVAAPAAPLATGTPDRGEGGLQEEVALREAKASEGAEEEAAEDEGKGEAEGEDEEEEGEDLGIEFVAAENDFGALGFESLGGDK